jgi:RNA-binding protein
MKLSDRQRKFLRREAHSLKPVVTVGDKGISPALAQELDGALEHHELLKIKVRIGDRDARDEAIAELAKTTKAELISRIGNIATLYRQNKEKPKLVLPKRGN